MEESMGMFQSVSGGTNKPSFQAEREFMHELEKAQGNAILDSYEACLDMSNSIEESTRLNCEKQAKANFTMSGGSIEDFEHEMERALETKVAEEVAACKKNGTTTGEDCMLSGRQIMSKFIGADTKEMEEMEHKAAKRGASDAL